jgi:hypothetical protein
VLHGVDALWLVGAIELRDAFIDLLIDLRDRAIAGGAFPAPQALVGIELGVFRARRSGEHAETGSERRQSRQAVDALHSVSQTMSSI